MKPIPVCSVQTVTRERLLELLEVRDNALYWRKDHAITRCRGRRAGSLYRNGKGRTLVIDGVWLLDYYILYYLENDLPIGHRIRHLDGDPTNNSLENIQIIKGLRDPWLVEQKELEKKEKRRRKADAKRKKCFVNCLFCKSKDTIQVIDRNTGTSHTKCFRCVTTRKNPTEIQRKILTVTVLPNYREGHKFKVTVKRTSTTELEVEADCDECAGQMALQVWTRHNFTNRDSVYDVESVIKTP